MVLQSIQASGTAWGNIILNGSGGNVGVGTTTPRAKLEVAGGTIMPAAGNSESAGLLFPKDPGGGGGDAAWMRYYARTGEATTLEIGISNDPDDHIALMASGGVGIGTVTPVNKLDVNGDIAIRGKHAFRGSDTWLRLNQDGAFPSGVHTPGVFAPVSLNVGGAGGWGNPGSGNVWITGNVGIGTNTLGARLEIKSPWSDWIFLRQQRSTGGDGGFHIHNPWKDTDGADRNRLEIAYRTAAGQDLWGQFVLHGPSGNVGIGTANPVAKLNVAGAIVTSQTHTIKIGVPSPKNRYGNDGIRGEPNLWLDAEATVYIKPGFQTPSGFDIAERFKTLDAVEPAQVVVFDEEAGAVKLCDREGDNHVIGIASAEPAFILGMDEQQVPIALCGRVLCKVDADIAPIMVGDLLTTSPTRGHAQKVVVPDKSAGAIIGKALGALAKGKGEIMVLVLLQ